MSSNQGQTPLVPGSLELEMGLTKADLEFARRLAATRKKTIQRYAKREYDMEVQRGEELSEMRVLRSELAAAKKRISELEEANSERSDS